MVIEGDFSISQNFDSIILWYLLRYRIYSCMFEIIGLLSRRNFIMGAGFRQLYPRTVPHPGTLMGFHKRPAPLSLPA